MNISRRRFLSISAVAIGTAAWNTFRQPRTTWQGVAMGADVGITLYGDPKAAQQTIFQLQQRINAMENLFSLYRPDSQLSLLNQTGYLDQPDPSFVELLSMCRHIHNETYGVFDPTVQAYITALVKQTELEKAQRLMGFDRVRFSDAHIALEKGMQLTLNGIAQGFMTDQVSEMLTSEGFTRHLVNVGEFRAGQGHWVIGVGNDQVALSGNAIATSNVEATQIRSQHSHIISPTGYDAPLWRQVSVVAPTATHADALSTAMVMLPQERITEYRRRHPKTLQVIVTDWQGRTVSL